MGLNITVDIDGDINGDVIWLSMEDIG